MSAERVDLNELREIAPGVRTVIGIEIDGLERYGRNILARLEEDGCWTWLRYIDPDGYGKTGRTKHAHRVVYELVKGPIPAGFHVHHVCRNRACVNPDHLEAVSPDAHARLTNQQRTSCVNDHEFTPENTYTDEGNGARLCRTCRRNASRRWKRKKLGWATV